MAFGRHFAHALTMLLALLAGMASPGVLAHDLAAPAAGQACPTPPARVELPAHLSSMAVGTSVLLLEDKTRRLKLDELLSGCPPWKPSTSQGIRPGISSSAWWAKITLANSSDTSQKVFLDTHDNLQDAVDVHLVEAGGRVTAQWQTGDRRPFAQRPTQNNTVVVPVTVPAGGSVDVYLRLDTHDGLHEVISPKLYSEDAYLAHTQLRYTINALYAGLALSLVVYNAFMYVSARVPMVGLYSLYAFTFFLWSSAFYGLPFQYLWPDHPDFNNYWLALTACLAHYAGLYFFSKYIGKGTRGPQQLAARISKAIKVLLLIPTGFALFGQYLGTFVTLMPVNALMSLYIVSWAAIQWRRGNVMGRYVILAFTGLGIGVVLYFSKVMGLVDSNVITDNGIQIGSMLEILFVAFGVANQLNLIQAGRVAAEKEAYQAQKALNIELDSLVRERTASLEQANAILHRLSTTDALTRLHNRRCFDDDLGQLLGRLHARPETFSLCILDIDHFKWINDHLGHQAGDEVLKAVALATRQVAEAQGAKVYRYGGEEFAVVFAPGTSPDTARVTVEAMRQAIFDLQVPHQGSPFGVVTASFGVVSYPAGSSLAAGDRTQACACADKLLYAAKHAGRNRVASQVIEPQEEARTMSQAPAEPRYEPTPT